MKRIEQGCNFSMIAGIVILAVVGVLALGSSVSVRVVTRKECPGAKVVNKQYSFAGKLDFYVIDRLVSDPIITYDKTAICIFDGQKITAGTNGGKVQGVEKCRLRKTLFGKETGRSVYRYRTY